MSPPSEFARKDLHTLAATFLDDSRLKTSPLVSELARILTTKVGLTSAGYPYLPEPTWTRFRDWVPHAFGEGAQVLAAADLVLDAAQDAPDALKENVTLAHRVIRQVVMTAAITAPPDAWLMRHILAALSHAGLSQRLAAGDILDPENCLADDGERLLAHELRCDLSFLLSRGFLLVTQGGYRAADHQAARDAFSKPFPLVPPERSDLAALWARHFDGQADADGVSYLHHAYDDSTPLCPTWREAGRWQATLEDLSLCARLVPLVLGLRAANKIPALLSAASFDASTVTPDEHLATQVKRTFAAAGMLDDSGALGPIGRRILERGPGPFGIIETYHPYLAQLDAIWRKGRTAVWVERTANVAASQDANRKSFERANAALDRFCADTGFSFSVFVEHALGKGEATRQRFERSPPHGGDALSYVGADLEDAAIDAAVQERDAGALPSSMVFIRNADIGIPARLLDGMKEAGIDPNGAVMIVGNGFHEVRGQTDERMTEVFAGYERAGILLLFTEETALSVDDLLQTAWNTYHAGFKYVHQRSGQGLRPASVRPPSILEGRLPASWTECAAGAGYVRLESYSSRSRTVYPYTPTSGHNPAISVTHFCVPKALAERLGLA